MKQIIPIIFLERDFEGDEKRFNEINAMLNTLSDSVEKVEPLLNAATKPGENKKNIAPLLSNIATTLAALRSEFSPLLVSHCRLETIYRPFEKRYNNAIDKAYQRFF